MTHIQGRRNIMNIISKTANAFIYNYDNTKPIFSSKRDSTGILHSPSKQQMQSFVDKSMENFHFCKRRSFGHDIFYLEFHKQVLVAFSGQLSLDKMFGTLARIKLIVKPCRSAIK